MDIGHYEGVAADLGDELAAGLGAPVDGGAFADGHAVPDLHAGNFPFEFQVLGNGTDDGARKYGAVTAHLDVGENGSVRKNLAAVSDFHVVIDEGEGADFDAFPELGAGADDGQRMDLIHSQVLISKGHGAPWRPSC